MSQPSAREVPAGADSRRVKRATVSGRRIGVPPWSMVDAKIARSCAVGEQAGVSGYAAQHEAFSS